MTWLEIYALLTPVLIVCVALFVVIPLARWQDAREDRRRSRQKRSTV
jgi:uncharacterized protein (DUF934 family)